MVKVEGVEERDSTTIKVRVINLDHNGAQDDDGDGLPDNQKEVNFVAERFDKVQHGRPAGRCLLRRHPTR